MGQYEFKDRYFDSADFTLTLKDYWLRKREGSWELKRPASSQADAERRAQDVCTNYKEITDVPQIRAELVAAMGISSDCLEAEQAEDVRAEFERWLQDLKLECFAEFTTVRCSYTLECEGDDKRVRIDLDQADFGYCVGEIEVLVSEVEEMTSAMQSIEKTAQRLGNWSRIEFLICRKISVFLIFLSEHYNNILHVFNLSILIKEYRLLRIMVIL